MTLRLVLIRHAKSSWDDPFANDHARVLNKRGRKSADAIGAWMTENDYDPDIFLSSDAARTIETTERIISQLQPAPAFQKTAKLYHAAPDTILDLVRQQTVRSVAVLGHNPGIGMVANGLVTKAPDHHRFSDYPTCAVTVIDFDLETWLAVEPRSGTCTDFIVPRDLIGTANQDID